MLEPLQLDTPGAISGADISSIPSADGAIFYSYQQARKNESPLQVVRKRLPDGTSSPVDLPMHVTGRGQLSAEGGELVLTAWNEAGGKTGWRIPVPGYIAPAAPIPVPGGSVTPEKAAELPNYGRPYASGVEVFGNGTLTIASSWADYLRLGMFVLRMNKLVAALAQLQRLARQAGWIQ